MLKLTTSKPFKERITKNEVSAGHFLPYRCHWNFNTILTDKNALLRIVKLKGFSFETADDSMVDSKKQARNNLFKGMASGNFSLYFHTIRRKEKGFPEGEMTNKFSQRLNEEWANRHSTERCFVNEHYITIIRGAGTSSIDKIQELAKKLQYSADKSSWENDMRDAYGELEEITERVLNGFSNYGSRLLEVYETEDGGILSEPLEFLARIANCGYTQPMNVPLEKISHHLPLCRLYFGAKTIEVHTPSAIKYAGIVAIKEYRPSTNAGIFDGFLQMSCELIISQSFNFIDRMIAISSMKLQQRRLIQAEDVAVSQIHEIDSALDSAMSGEFAFGNHHMTVLCLEDSNKTLESQLSMAIVELANCGMSGVRERVNLEPAYWAQMPCNDEYMARRSIINTMNLASFASFHNYPSGKRSGNHWGNAVTVLNTVSGTPYFFSFHVRDIGHTMIVGPTGAGKTVLLNFLCAQAQKFNTKLFFFDKDRGSEIFIRAISGSYSIPDASKISGYNPFALEDTSENRSFLIEFFKALIAPEGNQLPAHENERIKEAVSANFKLPKSERRLKNLAPFMGLGGPGTLADRLSMWHSDGSHAKLFDNEEDNIDFSKFQTFGIEMAPLLQDKMALPPVLLYLFHRIQSSLTGEPTMIVLDEAWALISNRFFAPKIKDWLKVLRKLNAMVVFATQSVEDATKSDISDTLVQQTATQIFLPNIKATRAYREVFMLSEREFNLVQSTDPSTRFFLVKQDNDGVIARVDLSGMNEVVRVLSGRVETVAILDKIIDEVGENPDDWLPIFYQRTSPN